MQTCSQPRGTTCSHVLLAFGNVVWLFRHLVASRTLSSPPLHFSACWAFPGERMSLPAHALIRWLESSCSAWSRYYHRWLYEQREGRLRSPSPPPMPSKAGRSVPPGYWVSVTLGFMLQSSYFLWNCPRVLSLSERLILSLKLVGHNLRSGYEGRSVREIFTSPLPQTTPSSPVLICQHFHNSSGTQSS